MERTRWRAAGFRSVFRAERKGQETPEGTPPEGSREDWRDAIDGLAVGDPHAFDRVSSFVTGYLAFLGAYRLRESWEDLVQEVLLTLLQRPPRLDEPSAILAYVRRTTYRIYVDQIRREQGRRRRIAAEGQRGVLGWRREVEIDDAVLGIAQQESAFDRLAEEGVVEALARLDKRQRDAIEACYLLGLSYQEAASARGMPVGTFRHALRDGLVALRHLLLPTGPNG